MKIDSPLFSVSGFGGTVTVLDGTESRSGNFIQTTAKGVRLHYSAYLTLAVSKRAQGRSRESKPSPDDIYESISMSVLDMYSVRKVFKDVLDILNTEEYTEIVKTPDGNSLRVVAEVADTVFSFTDAANTRQLGLLIRALYNKKEDIFYPVVTVIINEDVAAVNITIDRFRSIAELICSLDLHEAAKSTISTYIAWSGTKSRKTKAEMAHVEFE